MFDIVSFIEKTIDLVESQNHGSILMILFIGVVFGAVIQWSRVDTFDKIAGFAMLHGFKVPKMLFFGIGLASIGLYFMIKMGWAHYHIKPIILGGLIIGGTIFAIGMAILGLCPGTGPVAVSEGNLDVLTGLIGGVLAGALFTYLYPYLKPILGPDFGKITLTSLLGKNADWFIFVYGIALMIIAYILPNKEIEEEVGEV
ncbi:YeeE/YedE thiosulfate transporter family protein [Nitrosophilus kaiyonis]|uniref:YeeE/YedE thiosulfate transporter family protein n=1 Tax=Nitrosophilus kaiyonis TaxID=2930200 RepID=UPI002490889E|nr:YeeE/YedE thiosulfate transporter family protein [Nitrosophilus kaiyonis]